MFGKTFYFLCCVGVIFAMGKKNSVLADKSFNGLFQCISTSTDYGQQMKAKIKDI